MPSLVRTAARVTLDLLFPPRCILCHAGGTMLCDLCIATLPLADGPRCLRCWTPSDAATCTHCRDLPPAFSSVRAPFAMDGDARLLVHRLKYDGMTALAEPMAALVVVVAREFPVDLVVPVPLHRGRERSRGYNQSRMLAAPLAAALGLPIESRPLRRTRATAPLSQTMGRGERRHIVASAFAADPAHLAGARVLLVDDVTTTGATLDACAEALIEAGAKSVSCVTFARTGAFRPEA